MSFIHKSSYGTKVNLSPKNGFGNLFFKVDAGTPISNGGMALQPRLNLMDEDWDFDVNILNPESKEQSPHWKSPVIGQTYSTAWEIEFSKRIQHHGLPEKRYVFVLCENCENVLPGKLNAFFDSNTYPWLLTNVPNNLCNNNLVILLNDFVDNGLASVASELTLGRCNKNAWLTQSVSVKC